MPRISKPKTILLFLLVLAISCKKDKVSSSPANVVGQWKWVSTYNVYLLGPNNPLTPQNTGIQQMLVFNSDHTYKWLKNNITFDSGTYSTGHGTYTPGVGSSTYIYDSIRYYHNGLTFNGGMDYYKVEHTDSLNICAAFSGKLAGCYSTVPYNGSGHWIKQ